LDAILVTQESNSFCSEQQQARMIVGEEMSTQPPKGVLPLNCSGRRYLGFSIRFLHDADFTTLSECGSCQRYDLLAT
jgi:hypothetical protein